MLHNGKLLLAAAVSLAALFAHAQTLTWSLPADWEANAELLPPAEPAGAPSLKYVMAELKASANTTLTNTIVTATWEPIVGAARPEAIAEPVIIGETPKTPVEDPQYFGAVAYPATAAEASQQSFEGVNTILLRVTPYRWNGVSGILEKATSLTVTCELTNPPLVRRAALATAAGDKVDMVIISPPAFTNLWPAYVEYRKTTHPDLNIIIKNTDEIYADANYDGVDDAQRIHKYLEDLYTNNSLKYAILGAGCAKGTYDRSKEIPIRNNVAAGSMYYASDLYYSCMEKKGGSEVWDYGGDGVFLGAKKSGGGYSCDSAAQVDWTPEIACFRFPLRDGASVQGVISKTTRTYTPAEQMSGFITKLKRVEGGNFTGDYKIGFSGNKTFSAWSRSDATDYVATEQNFFDWYTNPWTTSHTSNVDDWEVETRYYIRTYVSNKRPLTQVYRGASSDGTGAQIYNNDLETNIHISHGQPQTAAPFEAWNFYTTTHIQKILNFCLSCQTGHLDMNNYDYGTICLAEASILNPNGGALVTMNNTREGWGATPGHHEMLSVLVQACMCDAYYSLSDGSAADAFIKGHNRILARQGTLAPSSTMAGCYVEMNTMGDPLVKLVTCPTGETYAGSLAGKCATDATINATISVDGNSAVQTLTVAPTTAGDTVTVNGGYTLKVFNKLTVNNGNLQWDAAGGVARNGIEFTGARGDLTFTGSKVRYFGSTFANVGDIKVNGTGVTLDFNKTGTSGRIQSLAYDSTGYTSGNNAIRSRAGGVFADDFTIPVKNGTLVLNTQNVGGVADKRTAAPLFALTNATLQINENPNWATEFLSRSVTMNSSTINVNYQSVGFGPAVNNAGFNIHVLAGTNYIKGAYDAEISGVFTVDADYGSELVISTPLTKSGRTGSLVKAGLGTLSLRASNAFQGGITVQGGTLVAGSQSPSALAAGEVTVENGATLQLESIPSTSITKLTVKAGGKLILPGDITTAAYKVIDPLKASLNFEEGAIIVNENAPNTALKGSTTSDGYFMNTEGFLTWANRDGVWTNDEADVSAWLTSSNTPAGYTDGYSVQFLDHGAKTLNVAVSGSVNPGYASFNNPNTVYHFTTNTTDASINLESLYTAGETIFDPSVKASDKTVITSGKATFGDLTTASVTVAPEGTFQLTGKLTPVTTISKIVFKATAFQPDTSLAWFYGHNAYCGYQINELEFYCEGKKLTLPVGTQVTASGTFNGTTTTDTMTITSVNDDGTIGSYTGTQGVCKMFDTLAGSGWGGTKVTAKADVQTSPTVTITIQLGAPLRMFTSYRIAGGDAATSSPAAWNVSVTENLSGSSTTVSTVTYNAPANNWWTSGAIAYNGASSSAISVAEGGTLYLNGNPAAVVNLADGARLAVTNNSCMTVSKGVSLAGNVVLDVNEAAKMGWTEVLKGAGLAAADIYKFTLTDEDAAAKIDGGSLYVATQDIVPGPYTMSLSGSNSWNAAAWKANDETMTKTWSETVTLPTADATIDVSGDATLTIDTSVSLSRIVITNKTGAASSLTVNGSSALVASVLDFSGYNGKVIWSPDIAGASVICGANDVTLLSGNGADLSVSSNGVARIAGTFTSYSNDDDSIVRFIGTGRSLSMSNVPGSGTLSFTGATLTGGYQNTAITYLVEDGDTVTMNAASDSLYARNTGTFDIRGGSVTVNPSYGAWWFGDNGHSSFKMSGGTFTCNATGTGTTGSGNGLLIGYTTDGSFQIALDITGGTLSVPNSSLNFYNPATMTISDGGKVHTKGIFSGTGTTGTLNVDEGGILEIGSIGLCTKAVDLNLNGGTIAGYENGAKLNGSVTLGGVGTIAATNGTTLAVNGSVTGEGVLTFGSAAYDGTVKLTTIPEAAIWGVAGGTLHLGELRPLEKTLTNSVGAVAVTLSNAQIVDAQTNPVQIIQAKDVPTGGVLVYNKRGHLQNGTIAAVTDGYLTVKTVAGVQHVIGAKWGNLGVGFTEYNGGTYSSFSVDFNKTDNLSICEIGNEGTVAISNVQITARKNGIANNTMPTSLTISYADGSSAVTSTTVTVPNIVVYDSNGGTYTRPLSTFTFSPAAEFDSSKPLLMKLNGGCSLLANKPCNSGMLVATGYSPIVQIVGDYSYDPGNVPEDEDGGDSISINVVGGNSGLTGKSVSAEAGAYPIAANGWNQLASHSTGDSFSETTANLTEVRADGTVSPSAVSATLSGSCTYAAKDTTPSGANAELEYGYIDDGSTGAKFAVSGIPYSKYDVYVYMGSDQSTTSNSFGAVTVTSGSFTTNYPAASTAWGSASTTHGTVTLQEGTNYFKVCGLTGDSLVVNGAVKGTPSGTRCGLAGIQIVNTGTRYETYTWAGESDGGIWSTSAVNWTSPEGAAAAWPTVGDGNIAVFNGGRTAVSLVGNVGPSIIQINSASVITHDGFVTGDESGEVLFANTKLSDIAGFTAAFSGGNISNKGGAATPYYYYNDGTNARVQFQINDGGYIKCVKMVCWQVGDDVMGQAKYAKYQNNVSIGIDFDSASSSTGKVVTDATTAGYGIMNVTAVMSKLSLSGTGKLTKPVTISSGTLEVVAGLLTNDVTVATGAAINVVADESADQIVITTGALEGVSFSNLYLNGATIGASTWTLDGGTLTKKYYMPSSRKLLVDLDPTSASATNWLNFSADGLETPIKVTNEVASLTITLGGGKMWAAATSEIAPDFSAAARVDILNAMKDDLGLLARLSDSAYDSIVRYGSDNGQSGRTASLTISGLSDDKYYNVYCAAGNTVSAKSIAATLAFTTITADGGSTIEYITSSGSSANTWQTMASSDTATAGAANTLLVARALRVKPSNGSIVIAANANYNPMNFVAIAELEDGKPVATDDSLVTEASDTAFNVQTCEFVGTSATNITFSLPENATQVVTGTTTAEYRSFGIKVTSGTLNFTMGGNNGVTTFAGRTVTADGSNAVVRLGVGDCTGYATAGTKIALLNGGTLAIASRDTLITPIEMKNGMVKLLANSASSSRALDLFNSNGNDWTIRGISTLTSEGTGDSRKVFLRSGDWNIDVAEEGKFILDAQVITSISGYSGSAGSLVKKGAGTLELTTLPLECNVNIEAGAINLAAEIGASGLSLTSGTLTGATAENIYVNGVKLADSDYMLSGNEIVARALTAPLTAALEGTNTLDALTWTSANGLTVRESELAAALTNNALVVSAAEGAALQITNDLALVSLAITNATIKFEGAGQLTTTGGVVGDALTVDATAANLGDYATLVYPNALTNTLIVGEATGLAEMTLPTAPEGYTITATDDKTGFVIAANEPPAAEPMNYTATISDSSIAFSAITFDQGVYTNGEENTVTIKAASDLILKIDTILVLKKLMITNTGDENTPTVYVEAADGVIITDALSGVASFDFTNTRNINIGIDIVDKVTGWPNYYLFFSCPCSGAVKGGCGYTGSGNTLTGADITSGSVSIGGSGTLSGTFTLSSGNYLTIDGSYTETGTAYNIVDGTLQIGTSGLKGDVTMGESCWLNIFDSSISGTADTYTITTGTLKGLSINKIKLNYEPIDTTKWHFTADGKGITTKVIAPTVDGDNQGTISQNSDGEYVVTPTADYVHEIAISNAGDHTIVVPPSVTKVTGVESARIKVVYTVGESTFDYTDSGLFTKSGTAAEGVTIALTSDKTAKVTVKGEEITLVPTLTAITKAENEDHAIAAPFVVETGSAAVGIKSIPGLNYELIRGTTLGTWETEPVDTERATGTRLKLEDGAKPDGKAFYIIRVGQ